MYRTALKRVEREQKRNGSYERFCPDCAREDRKGFDLAILAGYARPKSPLHWRCMKRIMAQSRSIQSGAYAETLLAEFDAAIAEVQGVIDEEKGKTDKRVFFLAVTAKREFLEAKAKALGFGATAGRPGKHDSPAIPSDIDREDLGKIAESYLRSREEAARVEQEERTAAAAAEEPALTEEQRAVLAGIEGVELDRGETAGDEVAVMDEQNRSQPS